MHTHTHRNEHTSMSCVLCSLALYIKRCQTSQTTTTTTTTEAASAQSIPFLDSPKTVTDAGHVSGRVQTEPHRTVAIAVTVYPESGARLQ